MIDISVGHAEAAGSFDLFDRDSELPTEGTPRKRSCFRIQYSTLIRSGTIKYHFRSRDKHFKLGATGDWYSKKGQVNAFVAKISVEPNEALE